MFIGTELIYDESLSVFERFYIRLLGAPINGLRIRARRVLPFVHSAYKDILDVGCGQGIFTFEIARRFPDSIVTGVDINTELLKRNQNIVEKLQLKNCRFLEQDITKMTLRNAYDLVMSVDNLEHIEDDELALRNFYQALRHNGEMLLHVPGYYRRWLVFGWNVNFDVKGHVRPGYTQEQIVEKVRQADFQVMEAFYTYGWIETVTNNFSYLITRADMKNKHLYALVFPFLLWFSFFGRKSRPAKGAGVLVRARKA